MSRLLIIGCGGVAQVAIRKCCQNSEVFTEIMIASRTKSKCDDLKAKLEGKTSTKIETAKVDADNVKELKELINAYSAFNRAGAFGKIKRWFCTSYNTSRFKHIARFYRRLKAYIIKPRIHRELILCHIIRKKYAGRLCQHLAEDNSGHYWISRKMSV